MTKKVKPKEEKPPWMMTETEIINHLRNLPPMTEVRMTRWTVESWVKFWDKIYAIVGTDEDGIKFVLELARIMGCYKKQWEDLELAPDQARP